MKRPAKARPGTTAPSTGPDDDRLAACVEAALRESGQDGRAALIAGSKAFLVERRAAAEARLLAHPRDGVEVARLLSGAADAVVRGLWAWGREHVVGMANPTEGERLALLAVGGYGRGVLAPSSDLDLLFLRPWKRTPAGETLSEFVLYALWDLGFKVGHASRTVGESLRLAREDMTVRTAMLEARLLVGDEGLSAELRKKFVREIIKGSAPEFVTAKLEERDARHAKAGASRYLVEPNVKESKGGLRDLHTLYWIAAYLDPTTPRGDRAMETVLTARDRRSFEHAFAFLWSVRCNLHFVAGRAEERLSFELQPEIARRMGWKGRADESAVERFMRRYFLVAKDVGALTRAFCAKLEEDGAKKPQGLSRFLPGPARRRRRLEDGPFVIDGGRINVGDASAFSADPVNLMRLFRAADREDLDLHPDAFTAVIRSLDQVGPRLRRDPQATAVFLDILAGGRRTYRTLSLMNDAGLLGRFLPEFGRVVGQTQLNRYHAYTVDEHTLRAIGVINDIEHGRLVHDHPVSSAIMPMMADKAALYLAMLLHDTGKGGTRGQEDDGSIAARRACERLGLSRREVEEVAWLVRNHLVMSDYAQKRDVADPDTVAAFAALVETPERLRRLVVLTTADIRAVGPGVWNGWKGQLLRELYAATESLFRGGRTADGATSARQRLHHLAREQRAVLLSDHPEAAGFAGTMEDAYFVTVPAQDRFAHVALAERARQAGAAAQTRLREDRNALELMLAAPDRPGLFADVARRLSDLGANVTGARVFTSADGLALDLFYLQDAGGEPWGRGHRQAVQRVCREIEAAARGEARTGEAPRGSRQRTAGLQVATTVSIDNDASGSATIIEVSGRDRQGLLADLAGVLAGAGLSIQSAHVDNYGACAVDAFYVVSGAAGAKLVDATRLAALRDALRAVFPPQ